MFDAVSYIMGQKAGGGGGGGNPNYSKTFTGTMQDIMAVAYESMTDAEKEKLISINSYDSGSVSMLITYDMTAFNFGLRKCSGIRAAGTTVHIIFNDTLLPSVTASYMTEYDISPGELGTMRKASAYAEATGKMDLSPYASSIPATLTIYFHNMPTGG